MRGDGDAERTLCVACKNKQRQRARELLPEKHKHVAALEGKRQTWQTMGYRIPQQASWKIENNVDSGGVEIRLDNRREFQLGVSVRWFLVTDLRKEIR